MRCVAAILMLFHLVLAHPPVLAETFDDLKTVYDKATFHLDRGEFDAAKEYFTRAIELNARFGPAFHGLGIALYQLGYLDLALTNFERSIELGFSDKRTYYVMAVAYTRTEQYPEALAAYQKAIELDQDFPQAYHNLGLLYYRTQDWEKSRAHLEKALELQQNDTRIMFALGLSYIKLGSTEKVIDMITQLRSLRDETKAAKLEDLMRPPPDAPLYAQEPDPSLFEPSLPPAIRSAPSQGFSSTPGSVTITGRMQVRMQGVSPEPEE